jgi:hypothetical protein
MVCEERVTIASFFIIRTQHEMVENELLAASEEIKKCNIPRGRAEHETIWFFFDANHGELASIGTQSCEGSSSGFFTFDVVFQRVLPFFGGDDLCPFVS